MPHLKFDRKPPYREVLQVYYETKFIGEIYPETDGEFVFDYFDGDGRGREHSGFSTAECLKEIADKLDQMNKERNQS